MLKVRILFLLVTSFFSVSASVLQPGFDKEEYIELMRAYSRWGDSSFYGDIPESSRFQQIYRAPVTGFENCWELYLSEDKVAVISIRGTTADAVSWLANFYAAMVPAKGQLELSKTEVFDYHLAGHPQAAVHVGWLVSLAGMWPDISNRLDSLYRHEVKDIIVFGHSQGGAISYLLTSHLYSLRKQGKLPSDLTFKTYCSAGPKPGNLFYAYEYENTTAGGWAFNVVNAADWVPEVPISIQTLNDFNGTNPFTNAKDQIKRQKFSQRLVFKHIYKQLTRHTLKAQKKYQKYLGRMTTRLAQKQLPEFRKPGFYNSNNYVRTGNFIVLMPDEDYYRLFPDSEEQVFVHHTLASYLYLVKKLPQSYDNGRRT